ncbi:MAG: hypothetical protein KDA83_21500 [Planctomycetales bacterium]|nr:hypothetical protein [Planctomycetales bacterium]
MSALFFALLAVALIGFQIWRGVVFAGGNVLRRRETPGPFWFIIAVQLFCIAILGAAVLMYAAS